MSQTSASTVEEGQYIYVGGEMLEPIKDSMIAAKVLMRQRVSTFGYRLTLRLDTGEVVYTKRLDLHEKFTLAV
jgi:hypothetical protein